MRGRIIAFNPQGHAVAQATGTGRGTTVTANATAADLSPDRKTLAYFTQDAKLVLRDLAGSTERAITPSVGGSPVSAAPDCLRWSPDGQRLAFFAQQDKGLYVTMSTGIATRIDVPKHARYAKRSGGFLPRTTDPDTPSYQVASLFTCGRWLDAGRLVFDRVASMPRSITVNEGQPPADVVPDTTTVAVLDSHKLIDSPERWEVWDRCGGHIMSTIVKDNAVDPFYVVDPKTVDDARLARPGTVAPPSGKIPGDGEGVFIPGSCDVLRMGVCSAKCQVKRYSPTTGTFQDLPPTDFRGVKGPILEPDILTWNPTGTQYAIDDFNGNVRIYDLGTGTSKYFLNAGQYSRLLGWLPS